MKNGLFVLSITLILVVSCGCTQSSAPVQPTATMTVNAQISVLPTVTTQLPQMTNSVSDNTVRINNFAFDPANITVRAGSIVRWVNGDTVPHRIQFDDKHISASFILAPSDSWSQKFDEPGIYPYICLIHPEMHGTVIVE